MDRKQYLKDYQLKHKEKFKQYQKIYLQRLNSDPNYIKEKKIQRKIYYLENKEKYNKYQNLYYELNKKNAKYIDQRKIITQNYKVKNKMQIDIYNKEYYEKNKKIQNFKIIDKPIIIKIECEPTLKNIKNGCESIKCSF